MEQKRNLAFWQVIVREEKKKPDDQKRLWSFGQTER